MVIGRGIDCATTYSDEFIVTLCNAAISTWLLITVLHFVTLCEIASICAVRNLVAARVYRVNVEGFNDIFCCKRYLTESLPHLKDNIKGCEYIVCDTLNEVVS